MAIEAAVRPATRETQVTRRRQRSAWTVLRQVGVYLIVTVLALCCVIPFAWVLLTSIDANAGLYLQAPTLTLDNFVKFFTEEEDTSAVGEQHLDRHRLHCAHPRFRNLWCLRRCSRYRFFARRTLMFGIL